ncbi:MAG: hypothetical protein FD153_1823 [Rhodospirillaceae bacterium]|nr:MAG: hypothetical protein FD153_1823 [Rhodospirillaceae bacterium]
MMKQAQETLTVLTTGEGFFDITRDITTWVERQDVHTGLLTLFSQHTSAGLTIQENADPDVIKDLETFFKRLVPEAQQLYRHTIEGPDDMPAHIRTMLTGIHLSIPVRDRHPVLGIWQGIYLAECRQRPHTRRIVMHLVGL